jgi:hypothetical protein
MTVTELDNSALRSTVAFTGRLACMTRAEAFEVVRSHGGTPSQSVTRQTNVLVVGELGWPLLDDGRPSNKLSRAGSYGIPVVSERRFLEWIGKAVPDSLNRTYSADQIAAFSFHAVRPFRDGIEHRTGAAEPLAQSESLQMSPRPTPKPTLQAAVSIPASPLRGPCTCRRDTNCTVRVAVTEFGFVLPKITTQVVSHRRLQPPILHSPQHLWPARPKTERRKCLPQPRPEQRAGAQLAQAAAAWARAGLVAAAHPWGRVVAERGTFLIQVFLDVRGESTRTVAGFLARLSSRPTVI